MKTMIIAIRKTAVLYLACIGAVRIGAFLARNFFPKTSAKLKEAMFSFSEKIG